MGTVNAGLFTSTTDEWPTPDDLFRALHDEFGFTLDACASAANAKCDRYWTRDDDALSQSWQGERVWCNPPYSDIRPWVVKANAEQELGRLDLAVMLLPANRTEQAWWQQEVEWRRHHLWLRVEFLPGRMRFDRPNAVIGPKGDRPPFGCCLLIWGVARETQETPNGE